MSAIEHNRAREINTNGKQTIGTGECSFGSKPVVSEGKLETKLGKKIKRE